SYASSLASLVLVVSGVSVASLTATSVYHVDRDPDGGSGYHTVVKMFELDELEHARLSYKPMPGFYSSVLAGLRLPVGVLPFADTGKSAAQNLV
ncbi:MAG: hypothetical protein KDK38_09980, partial [Leptospiraceae bacterium]|nr:hypothetical protein [Leptospiraceae bacterium]